VERAEAEAIYDAGREIVVEVLLRMDRRIQQLEARVERLERELKKSSRNSSRPPSSDPLGSPSRSKDRTGRERGAQEGHEGHGRPLLPAWALDEVTEYWPERCRCGHVFCVDERVAVGEPARHPFAVASDRHEDHAKELLADTDAIVTSDRWWAYAHLPLRRRQLCWSHLRRDFTAHAEGLGAEQEFGEAGLELCEEIFWAWEVFAHTNDRRELQSTIRSLQRRYKPIIRSFAAKRARSKRCRGMAKNLLKAWPALWTFAKHARVEPTNNHAERALRGAVIYRKLSLGSQSSGGEQRIAPLLSAHTTCRLQRRSLFAYLADAIAAHARGDPVPLLA
jgi:transposase